jgi:hypothetical protein
MISNVSVGHLTIPENRSIPNPLPRSGKYQKHLDRINGFKRNDKTYHLDVPLHGKHDETRSIVPWCTSPVHELFHAELSEDPKLTERMARMVADGSLPEAYKALFTHNP